MSCPLPPEFTAYLEGSLDAAAVTRIEEHLRLCADCREMATIWTRLGQLPEAVPGLGFERRVLSALSAASVPARRRSYWWPAGGAIAAGLLFAAGFLSGRAGKPAPEPMAELKSEVRHLRTLVTLGLLNQQSAGERLRGISFAEEVSEESPDVRDALIGVLRHDPNVNVRVSACEALRRLGRETAVRKAMSEALGVEESPLVKIAIIEALADLRERASEAELRRLASASAEEDAVRESAASAVERLRSAASKQ